MIFTNLSILLNTVYISVNYLLGQSYYKNKELYIKLHDLFITVFLGAMSILMSITYVLILPFIKLYTEGINDVEYIYSSLPLLFCLIQIISWSRYITGNLTAIAGYAKKTSRISLIEVIINIICSTIFVFEWGMHGVLFATVISLPLKVIYCTYLSDMVILKRNCKKTISILGANYLLFGVVVIVCKYINITITSYSQFVFKGILTTLIITFAGMFINIVVNPECLRIIKDRIIRKKIGITKAE